MTSFFLRHLLLLFGAGSLSTLTGCVEAMSFTPEPPTVPAHRLPMNNAYLGSVHSSDLRPTFVWEPSTASASGDIRYELQFSTDSTFLDLDVTTTIETFETSYQPPTALPVSRDAPVGARYFWQVRACLRDTCSGYARAWYVNVGRVFNDYNGDGYSDLAVGVPGLDTFGQDKGGVAVDLGGEDGVNGLVDQYIQPTSVVAAPFGNRVESAGDINGDGFADLVVGVPGEEITYAGRCFLYFGAASGLDAYRYTEFSGPSDEGFCYDVGALLDVNADGFDDVYIVSYPLATSSGQIEVEVFFGNSGARVDTKSDHAIELQGRYSEMASAGDVNGDGFADFLISDMFDSTAGDFAGIVFLYVGALEFTESKWVAAFKGKGANDGFGAGLSSGDFDNDGFSDIAIGNYRASESSNSQPGSVEVYLGSKDLPDQTVDATMMGRRGGDHFGVTLGKGIDINGDGCSDLLVGSPRSVVGELISGSVFLYKGCQLDGLGDVAGGIFSVPGTGRFGENFITAGDVNGDGLGDFAVGTPAFDSRRGQTNTFLGNTAVPIDSAPDAVMTGVQAEDFMGSGLVLFPRR